MGTRGQVGIIVRLAMAKVLAEEGEAPPVFLDDALTDSDDQRFEVMVDLLDGLSDELQIVVATCHWSRFRKLGAAAVDMERKSVDSR